MQITAKMNFLRISPRKVRLVSGVIKGLDANLAAHHLAHWTKRSSMPLKKLLESAMANAYNNFGLSKDNLYIKDVIVNGGPVLKRSLPKSFGSASPILKRTSHITIVLEEKIPGLKAKEEKATS